MRIAFAHLNIQGINVAVFGANSRDDTDSSRARLLAELTIEARKLGLAVEKSALAYESFRNVRFYGTPDLVSFLASAGAPRWTHWIEA